ncbi:MAG: hypothetical protein JSS62_02990 [Verrucomicrobia bacterium]|nr:hypothetical protein [Verrucomicrobiota bacterium]MBS0646022.1 hypothetical protein [Verrucomicrobiota bacterium]
MSSVNPNIPPNSSPQQPSSPASPSLPPSEVSGYIWTTLLPQLEQNQRSYPDYAKRVATLQTLEQQALATKDPSELAQILQEAQNVFTPPPAPAVQPTDVASHIWNTLLPQLVAQQGQYSDYPQRVSQMEALEQQALATSDPTTLNQILQKAEVLVQTSSSSDLSQKIQSDYGSAQGIVNQLQTQVSKNTTLLQSVDGQIEQFAKTIQSLQDQVQSLAHPGQQAQLQTDLQKVLAAEGALKNTRAALQSDLGELTHQLAQAQAHLSALHGLAQGTNPSAADVSTADQDLAQIQQGQSTSSSVQTDFTQKMAVLSTNIQTLQYGITQVQKDLKAPPPSPEAGQIQQTYQKAQTLFSNLQTQIHQDLGSMQTLSQQISNFDRAIQSLQGQVSGLTNPTEKAKAQADLQQAQTAQQNLKQSYVALQTTLNSLNTNLESAQSSLGSLQTLSERTHPSQDDVAAASQGLAVLQQLQSSSEPLQQDFVQNMTAITASAQSVAASLSQVQKDIGITPAVPGKGMSSYFDLGMFQTAVYQFMQYYPTVSLKPAFYTQFLPSLFSQLKESGVSSLDFSFSQFNDIDALLSGTQAPSQQSDTIAQLLAMNKQFSGHVDLLQVLIDGAHQAGMKVDLSLGGENAAGMTICQPGETGQGQADKLAQFMDKYKIDAVDFDLEDTGAIEFVKNNPQQTILDFFSQLHSDLSAQGKTSTLTLEGSLASWPKGTFSFLFSNPSVFNSMFDGLNLMLYGGSKFFIDANNPSWGIEQWLNIIGPQNAGKLHIGFTDSVPYETAGQSGGSSAGQAYDIPPGTSRGAAAAMVYQQMEQQVQQDFAKQGVSVQLGDPFWWPAATAHAADNWSRYVPVNGQDTADFDTQLAMQDFYQQLNQRS